MTARQVIPWYDSGMSSAAKVAISIPVETFKSLEKARARLKKSRSGAITEAVELWLASEAASADDRRYIEGYLKKPEGRESHALAEATTSEWEPWE